MSPLLCLLPLLHYYIIKLLIFLYVFWNFFLRNFIIKGERKLRGVFFFI